MLSIGDFARHGRVSVRMLRHYDAIGLLKPAFVDRVTGYRSYEARQLSRLNRIVALKGRGFTLQQVRSVLDEEVSEFREVVHAKGPRSDQIDELEDVAISALFGIASILSGGTDW